MRLLEMSVSAGVLILFVVLLRTVLLERMSKRLLVLLWSIAWLRLLLPVDLPIGAGIATPWLRALEQMVGSESADVRAEEAGMSEPGSADMRTAESGPSASDAVGRWRSCFYLWLAGAGGFGVYFLYVFVREYRGLAQSLPLTEEEQAYLMQKDGLDSGTYLTDVRRFVRRVRKYDRVDTPLVWGVFRQRILLPKHILAGMRCKDAEKADIGGEQLRYMLIHEGIHMRRHDNLWKLLATVLLCLHWFNPLVWCMYALFARDLELSCDEGVIARCGENSRAGYAKTLLLMVTDYRKQGIRFSSGFGKNRNRDKMKERIVAVINYKKLTSTGILCAAVVLFGASTVFAGGPASETGMDAGPQESIVESNTAVEAQESIVESNTAVEAQEDIAGNAGNDTDGKAQEGCAEGVYAVLLEDIAERDTDVDAPERYAEDKHLVLLEDLAWSETDADASERYAEDKHLVVLGDLVWSETDAPEGCAEGVYAVALEDIVKESQERQRREKPGEEVYKTVIEDPRVAKAAQEQFEEKQKRGGVS